MLKALSALTLPLAFRGIERKVIFFPTVTFLGINDSDGRPNEKGVLGCHIRITFLKTSHSNSIYD